MIYKVFAGLGALIVLAGAAHAGGGSTEVPTKDDEKIICRTEGEVGSRLKRTRTCRTKAEWAEIRRQTKQDLEGMQNRRAASGQ